MVAAPVEVMMVVEGMEEETAEVKIVVVTVIER